MDGLGGTGVAVDRPEHEVTPRRWRAAARGAAAGAAGALVPAAAVWGQGPLQARAAGSLLLLTAAWGAVVASALRRSPTLALLAAAGALLPVQLPGSRLGLTSGVVAVAVAAQVVLALEGPGVLVPPQRRGRMALLLPAAALTAAAWWCTASIGGVALALSGGAALALVYLAGPEALDRWDGPVSRGIDRVAAWSGEGGVRLAGWTRSLAGRTGSIAAGAVRNAGELLRGCWSWIRADRVAAASYAAGAALVGALVAPMIVRLALDPAARIVTNNDFTSHVRIAREMGLWPIEGPQFAYQFAVRFLDPVVGTSASPTVLPLVAMAATGAALAVMGRRGAFGRPGLGTKGALGLCTLFVLSASPAILLHALGWVEPRPVLVLHIWWSPTELLLMPWGVAIVVAFPRIVERVERGVASQADRALLVLFASVPTVTKPSLTLVLVPAAMLYVLLDRCASGTVWTIVRWYVVPAVVVIAWQVSAMRYRAELYDEGGGFVLDPARNLELLGVRRGGWMYWVALLPVVLAIVVGRRRFTRDPAVRLITCCLWFALPLVLLREDGVRRNDLAMARPATICWTLLWALTVRFWLGELRDRWASRTHARSLVASLAIAGGVAVVAAAGLVAYLDATGVHRFDIL